MDSVKEAEADNMVSVEREAEITDMQKKLSLQNNEIKQLQNDVQTCKNTENQLKVRTNKNISNILNCVLLSNILTISRFWGK